jgi:hypothetical protein
VRKQGCEKTPAYTRNRLVTLSRIGHCVCMNDEQAPESRGERDTIPVPPSACERRARDVFEYCKGLSFGGALATALFEKGDVL